jgi:predicted flap endonuclease-1-like 5' DNA nuclease
MSEQAPQTLAVFLLDDDKAAKAFLKVVQKIDDADKQVKIVDAAIAERTKRRGAVKVHQTEDTGGLKGGLRGSAIGVVVGSILLGPAGALIGGAAGGTLAGVHNRMRDIGIDDKFMKQTASAVDKGKSALFVLYEGDWSNSIGAIQDAIKAHNALLIQSSLPPETAAALKALVEPAVEELGGDEAVGDFEIDTEPEEEAAPETAVAEAEPDDLTRINGVGPKAAEVLVAAGIGSFARLARTSEPDLRAAFSSAHATAPKSIGTWSMQASFAEHGDWAGLKAFQKASGPAAPAKAASAAATPAEVEPDDLTNLVGIGPKANKALIAAGITSYKALAGASEPQLRKALHDKDMLAPTNIGTWPMQADYALKGDWRGLGKYNAKAAKGKAPAATAKAPAEAAPAPVAAAAAKPDDLTQLHGIGTRIAEILVGAGVTTYAALQHMSTEELQEILGLSGALPPASLPSWPSQAAYAARGDWQGLASYNKRHQG